MIMLNHNLRIFIRVAEKGSITETANELYISQPAVSKAIKILEDELNLKLFHRDKRKGLILTDIGHEILILARQMEKTENRMYQAAFRSNNFIGGKVRIASMPILTSVILSEVFYRFHKLYPYVSLELIEGSSMDIRKAIEEHQVDLGIFSAPFDTLDYQLLFTDRMIAVGTSEMLTDPVLDLNIEPERFIFCQAGHETAMELLKAKNVKISQSFIVQQAESVIHLAEKGNGIGIISEFTVNNTPNKLSRCAIEPTIEIPIGLAANDLHDLTPVALELKRMIANYVSEIIPSV